MPGGWEALTWSFRPLTPPLRDPFASGKPMERTDVFILGFCLGLGLWLLGLTGPSVPSAALVLGLLVLLLVVLRPSL